VNSSNDDSLTPNRSDPPTAPTPSTFIQRRAVVLLGAAGIAVVLAGTSRWWLPALPSLFGTIEANSELIGAFADLTAIVTFLMLVVGIVLGYLGFRSLQTTNAGGEPRQSVDIAEGGRGVAVGGDVNHSAVVAGNNNQVSVEISRGVTYNYSDVAPSSAEPGEIDEARRRLEELPLEEVPSRGALPSRSVMPLRPNRHFVGREEQLKRIAANLKAGDATAIGEVTVAASSGLGGVGKTQLACEFVYRYGRYFHGVYWLSFAEPGSVSAEVASCGGSGRMELHWDFHTLPFEERVQAVMSAWQSELPRLLVFDNCEDEDLLDRWLPPTGGCRVLVTSRRSSWDESLGVTDLPLSVLIREESVALLREHRSDLPADSLELDAIAEELGDLPLALDLAGRYLDKYRHEVTPAAYLADIQRPELLDHPSLREARGISPTKHDMDVWRTFAVSYWRLDANDESDGTAIELLALAARLAAGEPIPDSLLAWTLQPPDSNDTLPEPTTTVRDALNRLTDLGLLERSGNETLRMHRLVAAFALAEVPHNEAQAAVEAACVRAAGRAAREGQPARQEALLPHLRFLTDSATERVDPMAANLCTALNASLSQFRAYDEAMPYAERAWEISVELYGPEHRATLQRRSNIGTLLEGKRNRVQARAIYEEVLEAQERSLGREDPDVAATLNNLGASFVREDLYHETLPLYRRALHIRERVWERTRPDDPERSENAY
jgi:tetratricopeptide (TPR) repeat protein